MAVEFAGWVGCACPPQPPTSSPAPPCRSWDDGRPQSAKAREGTRAYDWIAGLFDGARKAAARCRNHLARFIAVKARRAA